MLEKKLVNDISTEEEEAVVNIAYTVYGGMYLSYQSKHNKTDANIRCLRYGMPISTLAYRS